MKGNKFLAAALAASMVFSTVPATALSVFADSVSVEASNTAISASSRVTVVQPTTGKKSTASKIQTKLAGSSFNIDNYWANGAFLTTAPNDVSYGTIGAKATAEQTLATAITDSNDDALKTIQVQDLTVTDKDNYTFTVVAADGNYAVTVSTAAKAEIPAAVAQALDNYFNVHEFKFASNQPIRNTDIASMINADTTSDEASELKKANSNTAITFSGDGTDVSTSKAGTIKFTISGTNYSYKYTANITVSDDTVKESDKKAIESVNATVYPDFKSSNSGPHNYNGFVKQVQKALKDNGYTGTGSIGTDASADYDEATATQNGYYTVSLDSKSSIDVALKYSSDQKIADTKKSVEKVLGAKDNQTDTGKYTTHKTTVGTTNAANGVKITVDTPDASVTASKTSKLATTVQPIGTTTAKTAKEAVSIVQDAIDAQLKTDGVDSNGVDVTVEAVNTAALVSGSTDHYTVANDKTADSNGETTYKLLVTASVPNDFYGWYTGDGSDTDNTKDTNENTVYRYLVKLTTGTVKQVKATAVALADKTINLTNEYTKSNTKGTVVSMTATLTPEDTNTDTTWTVKNSDGDDVTDELLIKASDTITKTGDSNYKNPETADNDATAYFFIPSDGAGTYTVTAKNNKIEASSTLTANKNFTDVKNTSYYADPVAWGYAKNVANGKTEATFGVGQNVTRAEFVTFLYRIAVAQDAKVAIADDDVKVNDTFSDVSNTAYYAKAVQWAAANNITVGKGAKTFDPNGVVTRAEAVTFIYRAKGQPDTGAAGSRDDATAQFTDVADNAYYRAAVTWGVNTANQGYSRSANNSIVNNGQTWTDSANAVVSGTSTTTFNPTGATTREQAISFIARAFYGTL